MKRMCYELSIVLTILLLLIFSDTTPMKAQTTTTGSCPLEISQSTLLFQLGIGQISSIDSNPQGTILAVASQDGVWLYSIPNLAPLRRLDLSISDVEIVSWSPDGSKIAVYAGLNNGFVIYDIQKQATLLAIKTDDDIHSHAYTFSWSPDGSKVAVIGSLAWRVWDTTTGVLLADLTKLVTFSETINSLDSSFWHLLAWSPDDKQLALPDGYNITLVDVATWKPIRTLKTNLKAITSLDWSSQDQLVITGQTRLIQVWDVQSEKQLYQFTLENGYFVAQWSNDGETLAIGGNSSKIYLVAAETQTVIQTLQGHLSSVYDVIWRAGDQQIISLGREGRIYVWDIHSAQRIAQLMSYSDVGKPTWTTDGALLAIGLTEGNGDFYAKTSTIRILNTTDWKVVSELPIDAPTYDLDSLIWSPDAHWLAIASRGKVLLWDTQQNWIPNLIELNGIAPTTVRSLIWSPDGKELAIVTSEGQQPKQTGYPLGNVVRIWSTETQSFKFVLQADDVRQAIPLSTPIGWKVFASTDKGIFTQTPDKQARKLISSEGYLVDAINTQDGIVLASLIYIDDVGNVRIQVKNIDTQKQLLHINGKYGDWGRPDVGLSADAKLLKLRLEPTAYELWDIPHATQIVMPPIFQNTKPNLFWPPYDACITSQLSATNEIAIWDVVTGEGLVTIKTNDTSIRNISWSPTASILTTSGQKIMQVWGFRH